MKKFFLIGLFLTVVFRVSGQEFKIYNWNDEGITEHVSDTSYSSITVAYHVDLQYVYEEKKLVLYKTKHIVTQVNNDKAVSSNNRIYIPMKNTLELLTIKARTVGPNGEIREIDQGEIKEVKDDEVGTSFKIFAIEGAEVGDQIEYYYTKKEYPDYFDRLYFQYNSPVKEMTFKLSCPANLHYEFKSYNGLPEISDSTIDELNTYELAVKNIPALKEEPFSNYNGGRQRLEFMLSYNTFQGGGRLFSWEKLGKNIYENLNTLEKNEEKAVKKILN